MAERPLLVGRPRPGLEGGQDWPIEGTADPTGADRVQRAAQVGQPTPPPAQGIQQSEELRSTVEQVADRVYELLVQDLRLENERLGR